MVAFVAFIMNAIASLILMKPLAHGGLALASSLSALANMGLLLVLLRRKIGPFGGRALVRSGMKVLAASLPMALAVRWMVALIDWSLPGEKMLKGVVLLGAVGVGVVLFLAAASLLRSEETRELAAHLRRRFAR